MTVNETVIKSLEQFGKPVKPDHYEGKEKEYFIFNFVDDVADEFGDDEPLRVISYLQIHYFLPMDKDYLEMKKKIRKALFKNGFTYPSVTIMAEPEKKIHHLIFECEIENDDELDGE